MELNTIVSHFEIDGRFLMGEPYGCGHINSTYCLYFDRENRPPMRVILQKINTAIFQDADGLMNNITLVTEHIRKKNAGSPNADRCTLTVIPTVDGEPYYRSENGDCYRAYVFVENSFSLQQVENADQFESLAATFGKFQNQLADFDASQLVESIPNFHNTAKRFEAFEQAVEADLAGRAATVADEIAFAKARKEDASLLLNELRAGNLPLRVTHNDTKLNNVLFDADSSKAVCVIDLDTVMPGLVHYDFGDSIRFGASTAAEDEKDLSKVEMDLGLFEAYTRGFLASCGKALTEKEIEYLPFSAKLMTYECGIRFLTDYLNGDTYFKIHYPDQNLDRCRTQFKLVADMEEKMEAMKAIVKRLCQAQ
ncbi:MAG: aminoglycoside phosphotransferase family protein [Ruminococcaceae bacterium]|nr:aminoglycoside phosphotransferase family protein [Oscillospiraceae bacterium]